MQSRFALHLLVYMLAHWLKGRFCLRKLQPAPVSQSSQSSQAPEDFQEAQGSAEVSFFVLQADRERVPVCGCGKACLRVWWVDGWVWVLVDAGCKRVLNNLFEMELRDLNQIYKT